VRSNCSAIVAVCAILTFAGCHKRLPPAAVTSPPAAAPAPPPPAAVAVFDEANRAFAAGSFDAAAAGYERYLRETAPGAAARDEALFRLGLAFANRPVPEADWTRAGAAFKQLVDEAPASALAAPAGLILSLRAELDQAAADLKTRDQKIRQLSTELERLNKIDAERRKRP
jgi:hypothetical protein